MFQQFLPGFEGQLSFEDASDSIFDIDKTLAYFEERGYDFLID